MVVRPSSIDFGHKGVLFHVVKKSVMARVDMSMRR